MMYPMEYRVMKFYSLNAKVISSEAGNCLFLRCVLCYFVEYYRLEKIRNMRIFFFYSKSLFNNFQRFE